MAVSTRSNFPLSDEPSIVVDPSLLPPKARRGAMQWQEIRRDLPSYIAIALSVVVIVGALLHLQARREQANRTAPSLSASR